MRKFEALRIPPNVAEPIELVEFDDDDHMSIRRLIGGDDITVTGATFSDHNIQMMYDDDGLLKGAHPVNRRAMILFATLARMKIEDFAVPLVGTYVVYGFDPQTGETQSVPEKLVTALGRKRKIEDKRSK